MAQKTGIGNFSDGEMEYLTEHTLARIATASAGNQPHVVPVVYGFDGKYFYFSGWNLTKSLKFHNILSNKKIPLVVDDFAPTGRRSLRGMVIRGVAEPVQERGSVCVRITPLRKASRGV